MLVCAQVTGGAALYLQARPGASPAAVRSALVQAAAAKTFDRSSPSKLLNVMSSRLRGTSTTPPAAPAASTPTSTQAPAASQPSTLTFPSLVMQKPSWCQTCSWCSFC
jgi:hypothetical protein